ncbi:MAG: hypothetical protein QM762_25950 [Chryseolinea sp.]
MRKIVVAMLCICAYVVHAQDLPNFDSIKLETAADCKPAEPYALAAANYLFETPFQKNDMQRLNSLQFIIKWMSATPDYKFALSDVDQKFLKGNDDLLGMYMGAMTRYVLGDKNASKDEKSIRLNSLGMLVDYTGNPANNFKQPKNLKKLSEAKAKGEFEQAVYSDSK